ncbi:MAG: cbb3-type cytochrome oxidase assembly protein CcoS [bacterium]
MSIIAVVLPLALLVVAAAVAGFVWAARSGQFDDTETPAARVLADDAEPRARPGQDAARNGAGEGAGEGSGAER